MTDDIFIILYFLTFCNIISHFYKINHNMLYITQCPQCRNKFFNPMRSLSLNYLHHNKRPVQKLSRSNSEDILNKTNKYLFDISKK